MSNDTTRIGRSSFVSTPAVTECPADQQTQTPPQTVEHTDAFGRDPARGEATGVTPVPTSPLATRGCGTPIGERVEPGSAVARPATSRLVPKPNETLETAIERRYGQATPALVELFKRANNLEAGLALPTVLNAPEPQELFMVLHPDAAKSPPARLQRATFVITHPGESWADLVRRGYPDVQLTPEATQGLADVLAYLHGHTSSDVLDAVVALPEARDLSHVLARLRSQEVSRQQGMQTFAPQNADMVENLGGSLENATNDGPNAGRAYAPKWNDSLRSIVLKTYYQQFLAQGLTPQEASQKAEEFMLVVAVVNDLSTAQVQNYRAVWLPSATVVERVLATWQNEGRLDEVWQSDAPLAREIRGQGQAIQDDARSLRIERRANQSAAHSVKSAPPTDLVVLEAAHEAVGTMRYERALQESVTSLGPFGLSLALAQEFADDPLEEMPGELSTFLPNESAEAYLDRTAPELPLAARVLALQSTRRLKQLSDALDQAGLLGPNGITLTRHADETHEQAVKRVVAALPNLSASAHAVILRAFLAVAHDESQQTLPLGAVLFQTQRLLLTPTAGARSTKAVANLWKCCALRLAQIKGVTVHAPTLAELDEVDSQSSTVVADYVAAALRDAGKSVAGLTLRQQEELERRAQVLVQRMKHIRADATQYYNQVQQEARAAVRDTIKLETKRAEIETGQR